jgi:hypothetical protein
LVSGTSDLQGSISNTAGNVTFGDTVDLGTNTLQGTTAVIDFTNFDVTSAGTASTTDLIVLNTISQTTAGQVTLAGNLDANAGIDVTGANLNVGGAAFQVTTAGVASTTSLIVLDGITQTTNDQVTFAGNVDASAGLDVTGADLTVGANLFVVTTAGAASSTSLLVSGDATFGGKFIGSQAAVQSITDGATSIAATNLIQQVVSSAGANATATGIDAGTTGQLLIIKGTNAVSTVTISDGGTSKIGGAAVLGANDTLTVYFDGTNWVELARATNGADLAEYYPSNDTLTSGDVVSVDTANAGFLKLTTAAKDAKVVGVITTKPWNVMGTGGEGRYALAMVGNVPVKVTDENGPVTIGDYLTPSSKAGYAMKANPGDPTIGMALNAWDSGDGAIAMLISRNNGSNIVVASAADDGIITVNQADTSGETIVLNTTFNRDSAGQAKIISGANEVRVTFSNEYEYQPVVNVTPMGAHTANYWVESVNTKGFVVKIDPSEGTDLVFNWMAVAAKGGQIFVSDGTFQDMEIVVGFADEAVTISSGGSSEPAPAEESAAPEAPADEVVTPEAPAEEQVAPEAPADEVVTPEAPAEEQVAPEAPAEEPAAPEAPVEPAI